MRQPSYVNSPSRTSMVWVVSVRSWAVCCRARLSAVASRHWEPCCLLVQSRFLFCGHQMKRFKTAVTYSLFSFIARDLELLDIMIYIIKIQKIKNCRTIHMIFIYCNGSRTLVYCDLHYEDPDPALVRSLCSFC